MKRTIIGSVLLIAGILQNIGIFLCAIMYIPHLTAWSTAYPSKLFFVILAGKSRFNDGADGLGLSVFFLLGIILIIWGLGILIHEYLKND